MSITSFFQKARRRFLSEYIPDDESLPTYKLVVSNPVTREYTQKLFFDIKSAVESVTPAIYFDADNQYTIYDEKDPSCSSFIKLK
jgi:hypothetical protein